MRPYVIMHFLLSKNNVMTYGRISDASHKKTEKKLNKISKPKSSKDLDLVEVDAKLRF